MRCKNPITVLGPDGRPLAGASVETKTRPGGALASCYTLEEGGGAASNPALTDAKGKVTQWVERGAYASTITAEGMEPATEPWDAAPGRSGAIDHTWLEVTLHEQIDSAPSYGSGTHAARPEPGTGLDFYFETDTNILFHNPIGTDWREVHPALTPKTFGATATAYTTVYPNGSGPYESAVYSATRPALVTVGITLVEPGSTVEVRDGTRSVGAVMSASVPQFVPAPIRPGNKLSVVRTVGVAVFSVGESHILL